jgi:minichromosome maintenance protein 10
MSHAFSTVASERARETKAREELRRQQQRVETTEKFSGLRIKNRLVASAVLEDKFADLRFARIPDVKLDMRGRWATAGVLVEKTMKQGSTGSSYSIWKLSDMSPTDYVFTVFLFGQAHLDWHREDPGTVWAVVDGELREDGKAGPAGRPTAACNEPHQLCKLGTSPVFGRCKGTRRDGNDCTMHVNTSVSNYCAFHANAALKSLATTRMALGPGRAAKFVHNGKTVVGTRGLGGRVNVPPTTAALATDGNRNGIRRVEPAPRAYTAEALQKLAVKNQHSSMTGRGAALVTGGAVGGKRSNPGLGGRVRDRDGDDRTGRAAANALAGPPGVQSVGSRGGGPPRFGSDPRNALVSRTHVLANKKARVETATFRGCVLERERERKRHRGQRVRRRVRRLRRTTRRSRGEGKQTGPCRVLYYRRAEPVGRVRRDGGGR